MDEKTIVRRSKFLSLVLRHKPEEIGILLDDAGWVDVNVLLSALKKAGKALSLTELEEIVESNNKKRFAFSTDRKRIRASQGHSVEVDLEYTSTKPPRILYHGTASTSLDSIFDQGILKGKRHHVHLSADIATAQSVGGRHGKAVVLKVKAEEMYNDNHSFFLTPNGVWLTDEVPPEYISF